MRIEYHRTLLADRVRNEALYSALKAAIKPGQSVVADIGAGTGLLGFMAAKLGARRVFLLENGDMARVAKKLLRDNGFRNVELVPAHSTDVTPPERVDIVVSETLGNYALEENIIETLDDARRRYLKPGGILIPRAITQFVAPVVTARHTAQLQTWRDTGFGLDFSHAEHLSLNNIYVRRFEPTDLFDEARSAAVWDTIDLTTKARATRRGTVRWSRPKADSTALAVNGLALWWSAELIPGITLSTSPLAPETHWEQLYLPIEKPVELKPGETLEAMISSKSSYAHGTNVAWTISIIARNGQVRSTQSMDLATGYVG